MTNSVSGLNSEASANQLNLSFEDGPANDATVEAVLKQRGQHFHDKREARIGGYEDRASSHQTESDRRWNQGSKMLDVIPLGQPIHVGHHSERRDRRYRGRAASHLDKSREHGQKAQHYTAKAQAARSNTAISSDDPEAIQKLQEKLENLEEDQALMKRVNKVIRSKKCKQLSEEQQAQYVADTAQISVQAAAVALKPDHVGNIGFASYKLQNNNANIRRIRQRIEELQRQHSEIAEHGDSREVRYDDLGMTVTFNYVENRLQFEFDEERIPKPAFMFLVKQCSLRKTRDGIYQRQLNNYSERFMESVVQGLRDL